MRIKFLSFIASFFIMSFIVTSCLGNDDEIEYSPNATISAFELDTIYGVTYKFTIDQQRGLIYNEDSLPVHADTIINKILVKTLTTASGIITMKSSGGLDSLINVEDSMDFSKCINAPQKGEYMKLKVYAPDMKVTKEYSISIRKHNQDPDSLNWGYRGKINDEIMGEQKSIVLNNEIFTYSVVNGTLKVYRSRMGSEDQWTTAPVSGAFGNGLPTSIIPFRNTIFATSSDPAEKGQVFESTDGVTWIPSDFFHNSLGIGKIVDLLLAPLNDAVTFTITANDKRYFCSTSQLATTARAKVDQLQEVPDGFPTTNISYTTYQTATGKEGIMLVGETENPNVSSDEESPIVPWGYMGELWVSFDPANSVTSCPKIEHPSIIYYNEQFYIFGSDFETFYTSKGGIAWTKANDKFAFPRIAAKAGERPSSPENPAKKPEFRNRKLYTVVQDTDEHFIYILFSKETGLPLTNKFNGGSESFTYSHNTEVWRARLNQISFDLANGVNINQ